MNETVVDSPAQNTSSSTEPAASEVPTEAGQIGDAQEIIISLENAEQTDPSNKLTNEINNSYVTESGHLYIVLNNHKVIDAGKVSYTPADENDNTTKYTVRFYDYDGSLVCSRSVSKGSMAVAPDNPVREGYSFIGWDRSFNSVESDMDVTAQYQSLEPIPQISVNDTIVIGNASQAVVEICIQNNPGILGMTLQLEYDAGALTLVNAENGDALRSLSFTKPGRFESPCRFVWDGIELSDSDISDGTAFKLTFDIADGAVSGVYPVSLYCDKDDVIGGDLEPVKIEIYSGNVIIIN